jgi:hypothetical protein
MSATPRNPVPTQNQRYKGGNRVTAPSFELRRARIKNKNITEIVLIGLKRVRNAAINDPRS